ncbi:MAG: phosphate/phosphite/phosphonate ABC transporter substrate-binding protein [Acetobacteraceae bacterium]|jgi:phosphonate transport system substrate-binding protein
MRRRHLAQLALISTVVPALAWAQDWKSQVKEFRIGLLGGENTQDRLKRYDAFQKLLQEKLGIPVKMFPAADYAGVMQGLAAGQLDATEFSPAAFAGTWLDCHCVEPVVVPQEKDGSIFYIAAMVVRKDSGISSIDDMKGHSLAFTDPNSASGYLIPSATLRAKGIDLTDGKYFSRTGFSGGHEQGVIAVLNRQYDACVVWTSGQGDQSTGFTRGVLRSMVDKGMLKMADVNIIWRSDKVPNGPWAVRSALPADLKREFHDFMRDLPVSHKDVYDSIEQGTGVGYEDATLDIYNGMIELREAERRANRQ